VQIIIIIIIVIIRLKQLPGAL